MMTYHVQFLLLVLAGWVNRQQQEVIDYLREENRVLGAGLRGKRLRLSDDDRRRLAVKVCIVKTAPPTKSRTYAPLEFRAEDGETPPLCSTLLSSSSCAKTRLF